MNDAQIREPLFDYLDESYPKNRIFEEKVMGKSRADLIMLVPEGLIGLEIKSDADTYERLERQVKDYNRFCDYNYIVVGKSHEKHVSEHVPDEWGILVVQESEEGIRVTKLRDAMPNPKAKLKEQIKWLWRTELNHLLAKNKLPAYAGKSKKFVQQTLLERVDAERLRSQMHEELFERDYVKWREEYEAYCLAHHRKIRRKKRR